LATTGTEHGIAYIITGNLVNNRSLDDEHVYVHVHEVVERDALRTETAEEVEALCELEGYAAW